MRIVSSLASLAIATCFAGTVGAATPGSPAPDFAINDTAGQPVKLSQHKGKFVVLEWTNPDCPFVQKHYDSDNMQRLQKEAAGKGVVWLTINSTRRTHSEFRSGDAMAKWMQEQAGAPAAVLIDETSTAGRAYAARTTPHMFVVEPAGRIVYAGAIDDRRSANAADVETAKNYVRVALGEAMAGKPVSEPSTRPYGCSVKY